jgi:hypothetical protein
MLPTVLITEAATAAGILGLLPLSLGAALSLLPIIGVALNGTSSVLYGTVPDLAPPERRSHAFGVFYTGTIGGRRFVAGSIRALRRCRRDSGCDDARRHRRAADPPLGLAAAPCAHRRGERLRLTSGVRR